MATVKITKAADVKLRRNRAGDDPFETFARLLVQSSEHRGRRFANGNYEQTTVCVEIVKVFANPEDATFAMHMPRKSPADSRFAHCVIEDVAINFVHFAAKHTFLPTKPRDGAR